MSDRMWAWTKPGVVALSLALVSGSALALSPGSGVASPSAMSSAQGMNHGMKFSAQDKKFLKMATKGSNFEIKTGHLAAEQGQSEDVKQFGQWMVQQHTQLNDSMIPVWKDLGMSPPTSLTPKDQAEYQKLASLHGNAFDQAYIKTMLHDHRMDLAAFKKEIADGHNQAEKDGAQQGEPVIQSHLDKITQIAQAHHISTGGM